VKTSIQAILFLWVFTIFCANTGNIFVLSCMNFWVFNYYNVLVQQSKIKNNTLCAITKLSYYKYGFSISVVFYKKTKRKNSQKPTIHQAQTTMQRHNFGIIKFLVCKIKSDFVDALLPSCYVCYKIIRIFRTGIYEVECFYEY